MRLLLQEITVRFNLVLSLASVKCFWINFSVGLILNQQEGFRQSSPDPRSRGCWGGSEPQSATNYQHQGVPSITYIYGLLQFLFRGYWLRLIMRCIHGLLWAVSWEWREGAVEGAFEGKAHRVRLEGWNERALQVWFIHHMLLPFVFLCLTAIELEAANGQRVFILLKLSLISFLLRVHELWA